ncbi:MAG: hypothetical protein DMG36_24035 [Acidobacteria bacterium]|nr:MAG: hypothetical protein DMG36_24035 [Acidobacteriota bacterium]
MSGAGGSKTNKKTAKSKSPHAQPAYGAPKIRFWIYRPGHPATLSLYVRVEFDEQRGIAFSAPPGKPYREAFEAILEKTMSGLPDYKTLVGNDESVGRPVFSVAI